MFFQSLFQSRNGAVLLLLGMIGAAGYALWEEGPGEVRRRAQHNAQAAADIKQLGLAAIMYAQDHKERYPDAANWEQELRPYLGNAVPDFLLPASRNRKPCRIAINKNIAGRYMSDLVSPAAAVLFFTSTASQPNAADNLESLPDDGQDVTIGYADSHTYNYPPEWRQGIQEAHFHREALGELVPHLAVKK